MATKVDDIVVVGAGAWGTALADVLAVAGQSVTLWSYETEVVESISRNRENEKYLKGQRLSRRIHATGDLASALRGASWAICVVPTQHIRSVFEPYSKLLSKKKIVNASKGIEQKTLSRVSEIFASLAPKAQYAVLSGPSFAQEVIRKLPTAVTIASRDIRMAESLQKIFSTEYFRAYTSDDVVGVEISGAMKNVIALSSGMVAGLQLGYNAQAALINRGIVEIARMGRKQGADPITFLGLSGVGDLVLTCTGPLSRNRRLGVLLAEGKKLQQAMKSLDGVAEGYFTVKAAHQLSRKLKLEMPITEQVYQILYGGSTAQRALGELMRRDLKAEWV